MKLGRYDSNIFKRKNLFRIIIARILIKTGFCKFFLVKQKNYLLRFFPTPFSRELWVNKEHEHTANIFFEDYLQSGDTVIDIGANIGTVTLQSATKVLEKGKIYSIEPDKRIFKFLIENIKLNNFQNIKTFNVALGKKNGSIYFSNKKSDDLNSVNVKNGGEKISLQKLDDLPITESKINLLKIDVLGYEKFVFEGAKKTLEKTECVHLPIIRADFERYGYVFDDIFEMLKNLGFRLYTFNEKNVFIINSNIDLKDQDVLAVRDLDDFLDRTKYVLIE